MTNSIVRTQALNIQRVDNGYIVHQQMENVDNAGQLEGKQSTWMGLPAMSIGPKSMEPVVLVFTKYEDLLEFMNRLGWP